MYLCIPRDATPEQIEEAFRRKSLEFHPDKVKDDPTAQQKFVMLTKVRQMLLDPVKRMRYDASLPPVPEPVAGLDNLPLLWKQVSDRYFTEAARYTPAMDALQESVPILLDGDLLVVGIDPIKSNLIGYLAATDIHNHVSGIISEMAGRKMDFRLIPGITLDEWEQTKAAEEHVRRKRSNQKAPRVQPSQATPIVPQLRGMPAPAGGWDEMLTALSSAWSALENRSLPQARARFIFEQLPLLSQSEELARASATPEEEIQRGVGKVLERIGTLTSIDCGVVALEYLRYRRLLGGF